MAGSWRAFWWRRCKKDSKGLQVYLAASVTYMPVWTLQTLRVEPSVMRANFKIELKMDIALGDEETKAILQAMLKRHAEELFAEVVMLSDKRRPMVAVISDDEATEIGV